MLTILAKGAASPPHPIRVVVDHAYAPYSFRSDEGELQGILIDQWRAWEKKTNIKVEIQGMDWIDALTRMRAGEFDVIESIIETKDRREFLDFTEAYTLVEASIFFRNDISGITDLASLKGFPVAVKAGDQHIDKLKEKGVTTLIEFQSNDAIIQSAKERKINVFVIDDPSALYLLNRAGIVADFRHSAPIFRDELRRAMRKGDTATLRAVSEGFATIEPYELKRIEERWFGRTINRYERYFTYAGYLAAGAFIIIAGLIGWTQILKKQISNRTTALAQSEQRFRQIAENIHEVFWLTAADFSSALYISPAFETVWGMPCERMYKDPHSFFSAIHTDDRSKMIEAIHVNHDLPFDVEFRLVRPDGSVRWIWNRAFPIKDNAGRVYRLAGIAEDITHRKRNEEMLRQSESQLRLVIDTIPMMAWIIQPDGNLEFLNKRWLDYAGVSMAEAIKNPAGTIHPEDLSLVMEKWRIDMVAGKPFEGEMRLRRADGEYRWFLVRTVPVFDAHGNIQKWYGASSDIEERKRAEEALRETQALLARVSRAAILGELTTSIAHEVNQPLSAVVTNADAAGRWLQSTPPNLREVRQALERISRDGSRASQVITRIRSLLKNGRPTKTDFDLDGMIGDTLALAKSEAERRQITIQTRLAPNLPGIKGDRVQLQQALMNLIMNAFDAIAATADGPRSLAINTSMDSPTCVRISVQDTGIGIDPSCLDDIFKPFHTTKEDGLGWGLPISRSIVESHGGRLWATANTGPGITFHFTLPLHNGRT